jgi:ureidoacrylate peracid hydrolase
MAAIAAAAAAARALAGEAAVRVSEPPAAAHFPVAPARMALLNVDMQNCFVENSPIAVPDGPQLLRRINALANACRSAGVQVIHTAHVLRADGSDAGVMREYIAAIRAGIINKGSPAAALHKDLVVAVDDIVLEKPRFGAFQGTDLELLLRSRGIDSVIVSGIATNICCETTAREATLRDFRMFFLSDGTSTFEMGGVSRDQLQRASCASLNLFGEVLTVNCMVDKLAAAKASLSPAQS